MQANKGKAVRGAQLDTPPRSRATKNPSPCGRGEKGRDLRSIVSTRSCYDTAENPWVSVRLKTATCGNVTSAHRKRARRRPLQFRNAFFGLSRRQRPKRSPILAPISSLAQREAMHLATTVLPGTSPKSHRRDRPNGVPARWSQPRTALGILGLTKGDFAPSGSYCARRHDVAGRQQAVVVER